MIEKKELKWVFYFALFVMVLTTIPYFIGFAVQGEHWRFSGFVFGVEDGNSYIAKMLSGANGSWLFKTPYSTAEQKGFLAFLPYILLGKLTSAPGQHEQLVMLFHLFRFGGIFFLAYATYYFVALYLNQLFYRKLALAICLLGGGLGWLALLGGGDNALELYSPETFGFLSVYGIPHLLFSRALLLWGLYIFLTRPHDLKRILLIAFLWILMGFFQPLTITIGWAVLGAYLAMRWLLERDRSQKGLFNANWLESMRGYILIVILTAPWVLYNFLSFQWDAYLRGWYEQNIILSPTPLYYLISLGIFLPAVVWSAKKIIDGKQQNAYLLLGWALIFPVLIYLPTHVQRRMAEGFWPVLIILMLLPLTEKDRLKKGWVLAGSLPLWGGSFILLAGGILAALTPASPLFISRDASDVFAYLRQNASGGQVVLASYELSNALPAWTPQQVLSGHGPESIHFKEVKADVDAFYVSENALEQLKLIHKYQVSYVIYDHGRKSHNPFLLNVFETGEYSLYQVQGGIR